MFAKLSLSVLLLVTLVGCSPKPETMIRGRTGVHLEGEKMEITLKNVNSMDINMPEQKSTSPIWGFLGAFLWYDQATGTSGKVIEAAQRHGD